MCVRVHAYICSPSMTIIGMLQTHPFMISDLWHYLVLSQSKVCTICKHLSCHWSSFICMSLTIQVKIPINFSYSVNSNSSYVLHACKGAQCWNYMLCKQILIVGQARELHMARRRREWNTAANRTRASNLQTYSWSFSSPASIHWLAIGLEVAGSGLVSCHFYSLLLLAMCSSLACLSFTMVRRPSSLKN